MFNTQILAGSSGQGGGIAQQSLKFNDDESQYLSWTPAASGNRKTWTWSGWVKLAQGLNNNPSTIFGIGGSASGDLFQITGGSSGEFRYFQNGGNTTYIVWNGRLRDVSAWYHIVLAEDTTQATSSNRIKLYLNGEQLTSFSTEIYPSQNYDGGINNSVEHRIGRDPNNEYNYFDGYMSDIHFIDGQALDPTSFGQFTNGYWEAIDYAGSYGTNGFHLTFADDVVSEGFNAVTYRGTGTSQSVSGLGLAADLVWIKKRNTTASHNIYDSVRGVQKRLKSDSTNAEDTRSSGLTSFDSDGFTVVSDAGVNTSSDTYVAWCWDAGSGSPVSNTDGSITSSVKANPDYGFSIISYTGNSVNNATIGTGLNSEAEMVIIKNRTEDSATDSWPVWHKDIGTGKYLSLSTTNAAVTSSVWNDGGFTNDVISVSSWNGINKSGTTFIGYAFHSVAGYSSIGSYTGTGAAGNAVNCGFRPAFVMIKRSNNTGNWVIWDTTRLPQSGTIQGSYLNANLGDAEESPSGSNDIEFTDTGFTLQDSGIYSNSSGDTFIYMAFADTREAAFWKDVSGQGNHWTPNNLDYRDSLPDSPANNFAVMSSIHPSSSNFTISDGNLSLSKSGTGTFGLYSQSLMPTTGKWYFEVCITGRGTSDRTRVGLANYNSVTGTSTIQSSYSGVEISTADADKVFIVQNGSTTENDTFYTALSDNDVVRFAVDMDNGRLYIGVNGNWWNYNTSQTGGDPTSGSGYVTNSTTIFDGSPMTAYSGFSAGTTTSTGQTFNFGQDSTFSGAKPMGAFTDDSKLGTFQYQPPAGFKSLCTANLPMPTIVDGSEHFNTVLYTGTGATQSITGVGFQPDFGWFKSRSNATSHELHDVIRGTGRLSSNLTDAEYTALNGFVNFASDGYSLDGTGGGGEVNASGRTYAAWSWKAGGAAVSNTDGSITSQVSANVDAGFSIISWTGSGVDGTIGHGLTKTPEFFMTKDRNNTRAWEGFHKDLTVGYVLYLNLTLGQNDAGNTYFQGGYSAATSSTIALSTYLALTGRPMIGYAFHSVDGFSKVGSYTGNGSTDGPFVYTGFRPAWLMIKRIDAAADWIIWDAKRDTYNELSKFLYPNLSSGEAIGSGVADFLSNGFKLKNAGTANRNASGGTYIYLAFAEHPFKYANAR